MVFHKAVHLGQLFIVLKLTTLFNEDTVQFTAYDDDTKRIDWREKFWKTVSESKHH